MVKNKISIYPRQSVKSTWQTPKLFHETATLDRYQLLYNHVNRITFRVDIVRGEH